MATGAESLRAAVAATAEDDLIDEEDLYAMTDDQLQQLLDNTLLVFY